MCHHVCFAGVADGVGGWRDYGVDPSQFSGTLMRTCERLVKEGRFVPSNPVGILTTSYYELLQNKVPLLGEHIQHKYTRSGTLSTLCPLFLIEKMLLIFLLIFCTKKSRFVVSQCCMCFKFRVTLPSSL